MFLQPITECKKNKTKGSYVPKLQSGVTVPCEDMKNKIGVIVPYMQSEVIVPCEDIRK